MVPPSSHGVSRVPRYFGYCSPTRIFVYRTLTFYGLLSHVVQLTLIDAKCSPNPERIAPLGLASSAFARHYSQNLGWFLFLALLRCFSSGGSPHIPIYSVYDTRTSYAWIAPFGYPRINSCLQIPEAFRSLPRPSSAPNAKASSLRSYQLKRFFAELCLVSKISLRRSLKLYFYPNSQIFTF